MIWIVLFIIFNIFYLIYRNIVTENYRYDLLLLKDELILKTLQKGLSLQSDDYKKSRTRLQSFLENYNKNNIVDFLYFKWITYPRYKNIIEAENEMYEKIFIIKNPEMKEIEKEIFQKAMLISAKNMCFSSFLGLIYLIFVISKEFFLLCKKGSEINYKKIKNLIFQKIKEVKKNEIASESQNVRFV